MHSHRERVEFLLGGGRDRAAARLRAGPAAVPARAAAAVVDPAERPDAPLVFASQARVPPAREDREQVLRALAAATPAVVKLRAGTGEQQTHHEEHPYDVLWAELVGRAARWRPARSPSPPASMAAALTGARGLVTVSSTAALEASPWAARCWWSTTSASRPR